MKIVSKYSLIVLGICLFASCSESRKKATEKLNELSNQADEFNSTLDREMGKLKSLDSVIGSEIEQIKIDSLVEKTSSKIDSATSGKIESLLKIIE